MPAKPSTEAHALADRNARNRPPKPIIELLRATARKASEDPNFKEGLNKLNLGYAYLDAPAFAQAMQRDHEYFGQLIQKNGIKI